MAPKDYISSNFVLTWTYIRSYKQKKKVQEKNFEPGSVHELCIENEDRDNSVLGARSQEFSNS